MNVFVEMASRVELWARRKAQVRSFQTVSQMVCRHDWPLGVCANHGVCTHLFDPSIVVTSDMYDSADVGCVCDSGWTGGGDYDSYQGENCVTSTIAIRTLWSVVSALAIPVCLYAWVCVITALGGCNRAMPTHKFAGSAGAGTDPDSPKEAGNSPTGGGGAGGGGRHRRGASNGAGGSNPNASPQQQGNNNNAGAGSGGGGSSSPNPNPAAYQSSWMLRVSQHPNTSYCCSITCHRSYWLVMSLPLRIATGLAVTTTLVLIHAGVKIFPNQQLFVGVDLLPTLCSAIAICKCRVPVSFAPPSHSVAYSFRWILSGSDIVVCNIRCNLWSD